MRSLRRLRPYFHYLRAVRREVGAAICYGLLFGAASGLGLPMLIKYVFPPIFNREVPLEIVWTIASSIPLVFLLRGVSGYLNSYYTQLAGVKILESIRTDYFRKLQLLPLSFLQHKSAGDLVSRGLADTAQLQFTLTLIANDGIKQPATLIGAFGSLTWLAFTTEGVFTVLICLAIVPLSVFPIRFVGRKVVKRAQQLQRQLGDITGLFSENLSAAREVRAFSLEERETKRFVEASRAMIGSQMKIVKYAQALTPAIEVLSAVGIGITLVFAYNTGVTLDTFISIVLALFMCYEPVKKIGTLNNEIKRATVSLDRLEVVLNEPLIIADPNNPTNISRLTGEIAFEKVTFTYGGEVPALRDVDVRIPAGTVCALVGPSGAGKTTFINLVPRFYEVGSGRVTVDGHDVRSLRLTDLRQNIAIVSQDPVLFNDSIYNNLLLGRTNATRDEVFAAAADAHADEFIRRLPQGYDTVVGERGALLSGGQKQRIALARAFLRNAPILILDEATSALDSESEAAIQDALKKLVVGKTVLIIAHRFSTIRDASLILVFDRGQIIAAGSHADLHSGSPLYKSLYDRQHAVPV